MNMGSINGNQTERALIFNMDHLNSSITVTVS